jgi:hypothetical protein
MNKQLAWSESRRDKPKNHGSNLSDEGIQVNLIPGRHMNQTDTTQNFQNHPRQNWQTALWVSEFQIHPSLPTTVYHPLTI